MTPAAGIYAKMNASTKKRPGWVWVISMYYAVTLLGGVYLIFFRQIGHHIGALGIVTWVVLPLTQALNFAAAITFFLLRKISVLLMGLALTAGIIGTLINVFTTNLIQSSSAFSPLAAVLGYVPPVIILIYAYTLSKKGVLT